MKKNLLHLRLGAALLEGLHRLLALSLGLTLEDGEGEVGDRILRLLEAEGGEGAHDLNDRDALGGVDVGDDEVELSLLSSLLGAAAAGASRHHDTTRGSRRVHAEGLLNRRHELGRLEQLSCLNGRGGGGEGGEFVSVGDVFGAFSKPAQRDLG